MAKDRWDIEEHFDGYLIGWYFADDEEFGLHLGEDSATDDVLRARLEREQDLDEREVLVAELVGREKAEERNSMGQLQWLSKGKAKEALREIRHHIKVDAEQFKARQLAKPWPEWALTAVENGWKPPKGWKP